MFRGPTRVSRTPIQRAKVVWLTAPSDTGEPRRPSDLARLFWVDLIDEQLPVGVERDVGVKSVGRKYSTRLLAAVR